MVNNLVKQDSTFEDQITSMFTAYRQWNDIPIVYGYQIEDTPLYPNDYYDTDKRGKPWYPYLTYIIGSIDMTSNILKYEPDDSLTFETWLEQYNIVISFTCIARSEFSSLEELFKLTNWFQNIGTDWMVRNQIAFVSKTVGMNQDAFVAQEYERRNGIDITFRLGRYVTNKKIPIESAPITGNYV